jgi:hypothetical protein
MKDLVILSIVILLLVLVPFTRQLLQLRIRFFRWLNWNWAADLIEDNFVAWLVLVRILLFCAASAIVYFTWFN